LASRQVTLLTKGYLTGRLNFEYPTSYSRLREEIILDAIEREELSTFVKMRVAIETELLVNGASKPAELQKQLTKYLELTLPYLSKQDKINKTMSKEEMDYWRKFRAEREKARNANTK
jgi:hypothetical protein